MCLSDSFLTHPHLFATLHNHLPNPLHCQTDEIFRTVLQLAIAADASMAKCRKAGLGTQMDPEEAKMLQHQNELHQQRRQGDDNTTNTTGGTAVDGDGNDARPKPASASTSVSRPPPDPANARTAMFAAIRSRGRGDDEAAGTYLE